MDHHCLFLLKCIATNNHALFVWFLIFCVVTMVLFLLNVFVYLSQVAEGIGMLKTISIMFFDDAWMFSLIVANFFSILWGVNLIRFQLQLVSKGQLTAIQKYTRKESALTTNEQFWNIVNFLMWKSPYAKDPLLTAQNLL